jgi:hypothetical protein
MFYEAQDINLRFTENLQRYYTMKTSSCIPMAQVRLGLPSVTTMPKKKSATLHNLRSGLHVHMRRHNGLIYRENILRLRHTEFRIELFDRNNLLHSFDINDARQRRGELLRLSRLLRDRKLAEHFNHGRDWVVSIHCCGQIPFMFFFGNYLSLS